MPSAVSHQTGPQYTYLGEEVSNSSDKSTYCHHNISSVELKGGYL